MEDLPEVEKQMKEIIMSFKNVETVVQELNALIASFEWPFQVGEPGGQFAEVFRRNEFEWFRLLCDKLLGVEKGAKVWRTFDFAGSWIDLASDHSIGVGITRELVELLHPNGRFMCFLHQISDTKKVQEHWNQILRGFDPDTSSGNYISCPFSIFSVVSQREWSKNWRQAITGTPPPTTSRHAPTTPFFYHPHWCPISRDIPFRTEGGTITDVLLTPFTYFILRFGTFMVSRIEIDTTTTYLPKSDALDSVFSKVNRLSRGVSTVRKLLRKEDHNPSAMQSFEEFRLEGAAQQTPGYCVIFDLFQCHYIPCPGQPFLQPHIDPKYQQMLTNVLNQDIGYRIEAIPPHCGNQFVVALNEAWPKGIIDLKALISIPLPPIKATGPEGAPFSPTVKEDMTGEDMRCRVLMLLQPITALMKAVQYHEFLITATSVPMFNKHGSRSSGMQKMLVQPSVCRDYRASAIQLIHLVLGMANGSSGENIRFGSSCLVPLLETMTLWASVAAPFRMSAVHLQEVTDDMSDTVLTPIAGRGPAPCLWWLTVPEGHQQPTDQQSPAARFVKSFIEVIDALAMVADVDLLACLPKKSPAHSLSLSDLAWIRGHHKQLRMLITQVTEDPELRHKADTAVQAVAVASGTPVPPVGCGLALLSDAELILCGGPLLAEWEVEDMSSVGKKPTLFKRPFCLKTVEFFSHFINLMQQGVKHAEYVRVSTLSLLSIAPGITASIKPGPPPLSYANSGFWRETKEVLKTVMHAPVQQRELMWRRYVWEYQETYVVLFCDLVDYMEAEFVRNDQACTAAVMLSLHRVLACVCDPVHHAAREEMQGVRGQPQQPPMYYLPADTWSLSSNLFRHHETKISRLVIDLRWRMERTREGADKSPVPVAVYHELVEMLMSLSPSISQRVDELAKAEKLGEPTENVYSGRAGPSSRLQYRKDYEPGTYRLNESGRHKVLSTGAPFEFKDYQTRGGVRVEVNGPESAWRHLSSKLPPALRRKYYPYKRPPASNELKWVLKMTRRLDSLIFSTLDSLQVQGVLQKSVLRVAWVDCGTGEELEGEISDIIEQGHAAVTMGQGSHVLKLPVEGGVLEVDLRQRWVRDADGTGRRVERQIFDPPTTRLLAVDFVFFFFSCVLAYIYWYYSWVIYGVLALGGGCVMLGAQRNPVVRAIPV